MEAKLNEKCPSINGFVVFLLSYSWLVAVFLGWAIEPFVGTLAFDLGSGSSERWIYFRPFQPMLGFVIALGFLWSYFLVFSSAKLDTKVPAILTGMIGSLFILFVSLGGVSDPGSVSYFFGMQVFSEGFVPIIVSRSGFSLLLYLFFGQLVGTIVSGLFSSSFFLGSFKSSGILKGMNIPRAVSMPIVVLVVLLAGIGIIYRASLIEEGYISAVALLLGVGIGIGGSALFNITSDLPAYSIKLVLAFVLTSALAGLGIFWLMRPGTIYEIQILWESVIVLTLLMGLAIGLFGMVLFQHYPVRSTVGNDENAETEVDGSTVNSMKWLLSSPMLILFLSIGFIVPRFCNVGILLISSDYELAEAFARFQQRNDGLHYVAQGNTAKTLKGQPRPLIHFSDTNERMSTIKACIAHIDAFPMTTDTEFQTEDLEKLRVGLKKVGTVTNFFCSTPKPNGKIYLDLVQFLNIAPTLNPGDLKEEEMFELFNSPICPDFVHLTGAKISKGVEEKLSGREFEFFDCKFEEDFDFDKWLDRYIAPSIHFWDNCQMTSKQWARVLSLSERRTVTINRSGSTDDQAKWIKDTAQFASNVHYLWKDERRNAPWPGYQVDKKNRWFVTLPTEKDEFKNPKNGVQLISKVQGPLLETDKSKQVVGLSLGKRNIKYEYLRKIDTDQLKWIDYDFSKCNKEAKNWLTSAISSGKLKNLKGLYLHTPKAMEESNSVFEHVQNWISSAVSLEELELDGDVSSEFLVSLKNSSVKRLVVRKFSDQAKLAESLKDWKSLEHVVVRGPVLNAKKAGGARGPGARAGGLGPERPKFSEKDATAFAKAAKLDEVPFTVNLLGFPNARLSGRGWERFCKRRDFDSLPESRKGRNEKESFLKKKSWLGEDTVLEFLSVESTCDRAN